MIRKYKKALVLGSGALKIGEAGEFDYSGSQALKALREEGIETVLINPNIATVQTSKEMADKIYFYPVTTEFVEKVIKIEKPDCVLLSFGGQTALNCGLELENQGIFKKHNIRVLGTDTKTIELTEDRRKFAEFLKKIDIKTPKSFATNNVGKALAIGEKIGFPLIIRSGFSLGGLGSGFCQSKEKLKELAELALSKAPQILIEESLKGYKEVEYEIVRDISGNSIAVCNMENFDPLGIHTGESIVVAPSQTLNNHQYYKLRDIAIKIANEANIIGECNVQFALDPNSDDYRVIELNPRLSRSSALASKATGYPLAFIAAKLGLGYRLHQLKNSITETTSAFFEPALDYVVVKIPRWDLTKFYGVEREIGSAMKSVGEIMAIGKTFEEALQKGLRMIGQGMHGFTGNTHIKEINIEDALKNPTDLRIFHLNSAFEKNLTIEKIHNLTKIDKWFLYKLENIFIFTNKLKKLIKIEQLPENELRKAKQMGFSDFQIARFILKPKSGEMHESNLKVRKYRKSKNILPFVKQIDTTAGETPAKTNYLYLTYNGNCHDIDFKSKKGKVVVLGSGAYRIGSSVEFDSCAVNAIQTVSKLNYESIMINFNPETVSTDYDICNKLYFDELTFERVMDILEFENPKGVILSNGGQIANNLATKLHSQNIPVLGTSPKSIDNAEDRHKFSKMLDNLGVDQPKWQELTSFGKIEEFAKTTGFPLLIRPSYVLSGAAMNVVSNYQELEDFLKLASEVSKEHPVVVSEFIEKSKEIEIDAVADRGKLIVYAISEHVEFAGVHSGDATITFPAQKIYVETIRRIKQITKKIAEKLAITGPFNIQFLAKDNEIKVIECNLRASRSFPFVSKALKINFIELATKIQLESHYEIPNKSAFDLDYVAVKAPQFSFSRLKKADPVLGVDMVSTGEVGCFGEDFYEALLTAMLSVGYKIPTKGILVSTGPAYSKVQLLNTLNLMAQKGIKIFATPGSSKYLQLNDIECETVYFEDHVANPKVSEIIKEKQIDLVINIPKNLKTTELKNDYFVRRLSVDFNIPLITNTNLATSFLNAISKLELESIKVKEWDEFK